MEVNISILRDMSPFGLLVAAKETMALAMAAANITGSFLILKTVVGKA